MFYTTLILCNLSTIELSSNKSGKFGVKKVQREYFLQYSQSVMEKAMATHSSTLAVHGVAKSWTQLSHFTFTFHFPALEKEMATHCIVLAWRIPRTGKPGGLPSMGSHRVSL